ncbi:hypothetical protein [Sebaldella termitidis]|uniref:hypothetical protein n=1 Tax=Sebaldella termitidis TaxID=826 RepID=UPI003EBDB71B
MKFGMRTPSIKKSLSSRTTGKLTRTMKKAVNPTYGKKGMGIINDPKKAMYNKVYNKTTVGIGDVFSSSDTYNDSDVYSEEIRRQENKKEFFSNDTTTNSTQKLNPANKKWYEKTGFLIFLSFFIPQIAVILILTNKYFQKRSKIILGAIVGFWAIIVTLAGL